MAALGMEVRGLKELRAEVRKSIAAGRDLRKPLGVLAEGMQAVVAESFDTSSDPGGRAWARLATSSQRAKTGARYGTQTLVRTGKLRTRITTRVERDRVLVGIPPDVDYGAHHQLGTGTLPVRRFLPFTGTPGASRLVTGGRMRRVLAAFEEALRRHLFPERG